MDENRIYEFYDHDDNLVKFVTHTDYQALEERHATLRQFFANTEQALMAATEELASLRAKVGHE